jgi:hypothetical protein
MIMKDDARAMDGLTDQEIEALKDEGEEDDAVSEDADTSADDAEELRRDPAPLLETRIPADLPQRLAALDQEKAEIVARFDEGELTAREYSDGLEAIADKRSDAEWEKRKAAFAREAHEAAIEGAWNREVDKFMRGPAKDIAAKGEAALLAFDSYVKRVTGDPANARLSDRAQLQKAHKLFQADFKLSAARSASAYDSGPGSASDHAMDAHDFARLDKLMESDPLAYEKAIERMSAAEVDEYLRR